MSFQLREDPGRTPALLDSLMIVGLCNSIHVVELHVAMVCRVMLQISLYLSDLVGINSTSRSISSIPYTNIPRHSHHCDRGWYQHIIINLIKDTKDQLFLLQYFDLCSYECWIDPLFPSEDPKMLTRVLHCRTFARTKLK